MSDGAEVCQFVFLLRFVTFHVEVDVKCCSAHKLKPTLKPILPFLQQRQASMRKTKVKRPEKEMATTARDDDHDSSLSGAPSAGNIRCYRQNIAGCM